MALQRLTNAASFVWKVVWKVTTHRTACKLYFALGLIALGIGIALSKGVSMRGMGDATGWLAGGGSATFVGLVGLIATRPKKQEDMLGSLIRVREPIINDLPDGTTQVQDTSCVLEYTHGVPIHVYRTREEAIDAHKALNLSEGGRPMVRFYLDGMNTRMLIFVKGLEISCSVPRRSDDEGATPVVNLLKKLKKMEVGQQSLYEVPADYATNPEYKELFK